LLTHYLILSSLRARRTLFSAKAPAIASDDRQKRQWIEEETRALVAYICLYSPEAASDQWPVAKNPAFWTACAVTVAETTGCPQRSGNYLFPSIFSFCFVFLIILILQIKVDSFYHSNYTFHQLITIL